MKLDQRHCIVLYLRSLTVPDCLTLLQPPVARKDPSAVSAAQMLRKADAKMETHTNGSEVTSTNIMDMSEQVYYMRLCLWTHICPLCLVDDSAWYSSLICLCSSQVLCQQTRQRSWLKHKLSVLC